MPIQIGVCAFHYKEEGKHYVANPYNFYIFPRTGNRFFGLDREFKSQVSSLEFLNGHQFDFSKWISTGISFVSLDDEERIRQKLDAMVEQDDPLVEGDSLYDFAQGCIVQVKDFLQNSTEREMVIKTPSNYHKRVVHQTVSREYTLLSRFNGFVGCQTQRAHVQLTKLTEEERQKQKDSSRKKLLSNELEELIGFRKIIDAISKANKPIVGHNLFLDMCYIFHNFCRKLPSTVQEFKSAVHSVFPCVYDTKYLGHNIPKLQSVVKNTVLGDLYESLTKPSFENCPLIVFGREFEKYQTGAVHEAGFDAYLTGVCFLRILGKDQEMTKSSQVKITKKYQNRVFLMASCMNYFSMTEEDILDYSNIFKLHGFPVNWKTGDIQQTFKELGQFHIRWIDDQSCLLVLKKDSIPVALGMASRKHKDFKFEQLDMSKKRKRDDDMEIDQSKPKKPKCIIQ